MKTPLVFVLMSTYNGEQFLREQLDSVLAQKGVDIRLLVRDDGSSDSTCQILDEYCKYHTNIELIKGENLGFIKSFSALIKLAANNPVVPDCYAFCDQDDVWMPEKLSVAYRSLSVLDANKPCLFTSNSMEVDTFGNEMELFHLGHTPRYKKGNVLVYGTEQGCSMVFNRKAVEVYASCEPTITWHDRWLYHICYFLGQTTYTHKPLFFYRIHKNNALANNKTSSLANEKYKIVRIFRLLFTEPPMTRHVEMAREFYEHFGDQLSEEDRQIFKRYIVCRRNIISKIYMLFSSEFSYPFSDANEARFLKWQIIAGRL